MIGLEIIIAKTAKKCLYLRVQALKALISTHDLLVIRSIIVVHRDYLSLINVELLF
jgi:hypothetical protein